MNPTIDHIIGVAHSVGLSADERKELARILAGSEELLLADLSKIVDEDPQWLVEAVRNFQAKRKAVKEGDEALWMKVIYDEERLLAAVAR